MVLVVLFVGDRALLRGRTAPLVSVTVAPGQLNTEKASDELCEAALDQNPLSSAASLYESDAYRLGKEAYARGDIPDALKHLKRSARGGYAKAQNALGWLYEGNGADVDFEAAFRWFQMSAAQGDPGGESQLAWLYDHALHRNLALALHWYEKAAAQGDAAALCSLACFYSTGDSVHQDKNRARILYQKAAH